jgi:hypothetical protein
MIHRGGETGREHLFITLLRSYVDDHFPGAVVDHPVLHGYGFAISHGGGLSVAYKDLGEPGYLHLAGSVAIDVPDVTASLLWVNQRNRNTMLGRYYCAASRDGGQCAVVFDEAVHPVLLDPQLRPNVSWVFGLLQAFIEDSVTRSQEFLRDHPGRAFTLDDVTTLVVLAGGE